MCFPAAPFRRPIADWNSNPCRRLGKRAAMNRFFAYLLLLLAAVLEAGGDALVRIGLHHSTMASRGAFFAAGAIVLFAYGLAVNAPAWDFGRLLGVYVTLFFLVAQAINLIAFGVRPHLPIYVGGALIVGGGLVITLWRA
jgi:drug/metabolite transporter (DMT)-like permease